MAVKFPNASLSYQVDGVNKIHYLWVDEISQPHNLSASKHQSRQAAFVYPRAYAPGNMSISGTCDSQEDYQRFAFFLREHQLALINSPVTDRFARTNTGNRSGFNRLLRFSLPTESVLLRGFIEGAFTVKNKGVFEFAPQYNFNFFVVFDQLSTDIGISHIIKGFYESDDDAFISRKNAPVETRPPSEIHDPPIVRPEIPEIHDPPIVR